MEQQSRDSLTRILFVCYDARQGYAKPEQALDEIQKVAARGVGMWVCRICQNVFSSNIPKQADYFGDKCLSCVARAELVAKCNR